MVEQPYAGEGHCYAILVASLDNIVVTNRAAGLCYVLDTALVARSMLSPKGKKASLPRLTP